MHIFVPVLFRRVGDQLAGHALDRFLAGRIHVGHDKNIGKKKCFAELFVKISRAGKEMRLKHAHDASTPSRFHTRKSCSAFGWMMRIVVVYRDSSCFAFLFPSAIDAGKFLNTGLHRTERNAQLKTDSNCGKRILNVVLPRNLKCYLSKVLKSTRNGKCACVFFMPDIDGLYVRLRRQSVGQKFLLDELRHDILKRRLVETQHHKTVERNFVRELDERSFDVFEIAITIEVISLEGRQHLSLIHISEPTRLGM